METGLFCFRSAAILETLRSDQYAGVRVGIAEYLDADAANRILNG